VKELKSLTIRIDKEIHQKLKIFAANENMSMKEVIIKAITIYEQSKTLKQSNRDMKHKLYRLKYDAHIEEKQCLTKKYPLQDKDYRN